MRHGLRRTFLCLLLLVSFTPSLLLCGQVDLSPQLLKLAMGQQPARDHQEYTPILPPASAAEFLTQAAEATKYLGDLPIDQVMARDLLEKLLGAFLVEFNDEIATLLKAFGINLPPNWATIPLKYLLDLIKFKSYNQDLANQLLTQWQGSMTPEQEETLKRLWLSQTVVKTGFDSSLSMADDATEGIYDLIDLIYGACNVLKKIGDKFENLPIVGAVIKKIRLMISQRVIFALNNAVDLVTAKMKEPAKSRVRGIFTALTTTYIKWAGIQIGDGFGGINPETLTKIGAKILGKFLLLMPPKIGYVSLTKTPAQYGAEHALAGAQTGDFSQAAAQVLDDGVDGSENAVLESMVKTVIRKQKLSRQERQIANVAGAISQIAQLVHFVDPTSFARIIAIGAGILAGGLQLHTVFNSGITLYRLPGQVDQGVRLAFDPQAGPPSPPTSGSAFEDQEVVAAPTGYIEMIAGRIRASDEQFTAAADKLKAAVDTTDATRVERGLAAVEDASHGVRHNIKLLASFLVPSDGGPEEMRSLFGQGLMDHDLKSAAVYGDALAYVFRPSASQRPALKQKIDALRQQTSGFLASVAEVAASGRMLKGAYLGLLAPSAVFAGDSFEVSATLVSAGTQAASKVRVQLALPKGYVLASGPAAFELESLEPGKETAFKWTVKKPAGPFRRSMLVLNVMSRNAPEANHSVLVTE